MQPDDIEICPRAEVAEALQRRLFAWIVSIGDPNGRPPREIDPNDPRVLRLEFLDVGAAPHPGHRPGPTTAHISQILDLYERSRTASGAILVHCWAGISRSSAAALILLARDYGVGREAEAVRDLRAVRGGHRADPSREMIQIADRALGRGGALTAALLVEFGG